MLDKRLKLCADMVKGSRVCDIGTDHACLPAELLKSGKCRSAIAADINEAPLEAARTTLEKEGVTDRAELILSDGLKNIPEQGITDIVIAGMGGELISRILSECPWSLEGKNLILQPMTRPEQLIKWLCENGFEIIDQRAVSCRRGSADGRFFYTVINAKKGSTAFTPTPIFEQTGKLDLSDPEAAEYVRNKAESLYSAGYALRDSGRSEQAIKKISLAAEMIIKTGGRPMYTVKDIFAMMDTIAPMKNLHKGDNSGLLMGDTGEQVTKVLFTLDITKEAVLEAVETGAQVIISHHPVIFNPLYRLEENDPACLAFRHGIACICFHSPLDISKGGINDIIFDMLEPSMSLKKLSVLEPIHPDGSGYGWVCSVGEHILAKELGHLLHAAFKCRIVRYTDTGKQIKKLAFCSGGAGSTLHLAMKYDIDAYICGDVKHDQWITARNNDIALYDCGHFHTEDIVIPYLIKRFNEGCPGLETVRAKADRDPVDYIV
ncbi:MAG: Nif3-like dinuclear metal center hexameric protein [Oscillospiraceae bacterium]|nr:Nif3-like dinuclear metal center hexameric protein [Oscillospiraceae bacterium]